ncbi:ATP-dependent sacrificial sulfur transferase LarE [Rubripirellula amarantea]|uniref:tRNA-specific 2-thiouridylase MnmA n=1 Tax=Rubripirellula amarantea TaxID=2527999 RepID=A0A5C5WGG9_9BACT|nr:ATP-dependent sacrificial sulfur transferase LarE [Rubripirellula amarantea]MDA8745691.1 ATP-dependent sacrificial sulfur transferase LarE [Rubripirellula amarantea]TWT49113.1 tRNA-specific 2-thiouridylase MnmA [Rubripirellula amarantea]
MPSNFPEPTVESAILASRLLDEMQRYPSPIVAFSGGVDSSVVAAAAIRVHVDAIAVTATSPSLASWQRDTASNLAREIGIEHHWIQTNEGELADYRRNDRTRCFHCKTTLYQSIQSIIKAHSNRTILSGTNKDDLGDYRPGLEAGHNAGVKTPLADLGMTKRQVRQLATHFGLSNQDLPASPCLASRIVYGVEVTPDRLSKIDAAEDWIRRHGFSDVRVRLEQNEAARVEVPHGEVQRLVELNDDHCLTKAFEQLGFADVTLDPRGLRSGNLNEALFTIDNSRSKSSTVVTHD